MNFSKEYEHLVAQLKALRNSSRSSFDSDCAVFEKRLVEYDRAAWLELNSSQQQQSSSSTNNNSNNVAAAYSSRYTSSPSALLAVSGVACAIQTPAAKALQSVHPLISNFSRIVSARRFPSTGGEKWQPPDEFERRSSKYWVLPEHATAVKLFLLRHLPLLEVNETPSVADKFVDQNDTQVSQYINSVYFDSSAAATTTNSSGEQKMSLECYHRRIAQEEGAVLIRCRFYAGIAPNAFEAKMMADEEARGGGGGGGGVGGDDDSGSSRKKKKNSPAAESPPASPSSDWSSPLPLPAKGSDSICYVEIKTHHEMDPSTKERLPMYLHLVDPFFAGTVTVNDVINRMITDGHVKPTRRDNLIKLGTMLQAYSTHLNKPTSAGGGGGKFRPIVRTVYHRSAFQRSDNNEVRISFDFPMVLVTERGHTMKQAAMARDFSREETTPFPFGVFELKLGGGNEPEWVQQLLATGWVRRVDKFSKYQCAVAMFFRSSVRMLPFWLPEVTKRPPAFQNVSRILKALHSNAVSVGGGGGGDASPLLLGAAAAASSSSSSSTSALQLSLAANGKQKKQDGGGGRGADDTDGDDERAPLLGTRSSTRHSVASATAAASGGGGGSPSLGPAKRSDHSLQDALVTSSPTAKAAASSTTGYGGFGHNDAGGIDNNNSRNKHPFSVMDADEVSNSGKKNNGEQSCCPPTCMICFGCGCCGEEEGADQNKKDDAIPTNIMRQKPNDPKVFMAAERSLLKLQFGSCLLLGVGLSLLTFSSSGATFGTAVLILAALITIWAFIVYRWRLNFIVTKKYEPNQRFDDRFGPIAFTVGVITIVIMALVVSYTNKAPALFTCVKQQPHCDLEPHAAELKSLKRFTLDGGPMPWTDLTLHEVETRVTTCANYQSNGAFSEPMSAGGDGGSSSSSSSGNSKSPTIKAYYELDEIKFCFEGFDCEREVFGIWRDHADMPIGSTDDINENHTTSKIELFVRNDTALAERLPPRMRVFDTLLSWQCQWGIFSKTTDFWGAADGGAVSNARPECGVAPFNDLVRKHSDPPQQTTNATTTTEDATPLFPPSTKVTCTTRLRSNFQYLDVPFAGVTNGTLRVMPTFRNARDRALQMNPTSVSVTAVVKLKRTGFLSYSSLMQAWSTLMAVYTEPQSTFVSFKK